MPETTPAPPSDLRPRGRGRSFWRAVVAEYEPRCDQIELLAEVCRQLDLLDALRDAAAGEVMLDGKAHPAVVEARQVRMELRRSLAALGLSDDEEDRIPVPVNPRSWQARKAARARWDRHA